MPDGPAVPSSSPPPPSPSSPPPSPLAEPAALAAPRPARRRFFAHEVVQTSAMDCGPAALKCLLEGFGVRASYGRLREACQTSVDGTSIDTLEEVAGLLGLEAEQIMLPAEHVACPAADVLPAIAVVRLPSGATHFVVLWRRVGAYVQIMDPARGRRWAHAAEVTRDLYLHTQTVPADAFRAFATDGGFTSGLSWRVRRLVGATRAATLTAAIEAACAAPSWRPIARVDGAIRAAEVLVERALAKPGADVDRLLRAALDEAGGDGAFTEVLDAHACARAMPAAAAAAGDGGAPVSEIGFRGAVLLHVRGRRPRDAVAGVGADGSDAAVAVPAVPLPRELAAALLEERVSLRRAFAPLMGARARVATFVLGILALCAAVGALAEVVLARPFFFPGGSAAGAGPAAASRGAASSGRPLGLLFAVVTGMLLLEVPLAAGVRALGRALDRGLRRAFLRKLPRLGDRYFGSRPASDMAERAHRLHQIRLLPELIVRLGRTFVELVLSAIALAWLYPGGAPLAFAVVAVACAIPALALPVLTERDLRLRTHAGALTRYDLDVLLGLAAVRTHGAERALAREHDARLEEWRRAGQALIRCAVWGEGAVVVVAAAGAVLLVGGYLRAVSSGAASGEYALLVLFFALGLPARVATLAGLWRRLPDQRNVAARLLEPLGAPEDDDGASDDAHAGGPSPPALSSPPLASPPLASPPPSSPRPSSPPPSRPAPSSSPDPAVSVTLDGVGVEAGGRPILHDVTAHIAAGEHVAIVGPSGAGKSTLIGLLLGLHRPTVGVVQVDGMVLGGTVLAELRAVTAWVEPGVHLWNRSIADNVAYGGAARPSEDELARVVADAELTEAVGRMSGGVGALVGDGGKLLSGGEGQRLRFARELWRVPHPRLVLLDEPFRGLDRDARARLLARARARWAGATLVLVTHDIDETRAFPRVMVVDGGRIVEDGDPAVLAATPGARYRALLDAEARVRAARWAAAVWRRFTVRDGRVWQDGP